MNKRHVRGFTLYELLVTVLVIGVILTVGIPNFSAFTSNSRISTTANDLHSSFYLARSEAARSKAPVTICASNDSMADPPTCAGSFNDGWIIFVDLDGDIAVDGGEPVLRRHPAPPSQLTITTNGAATYFGFAPTGLGRGDVAGTSIQTAVICDGRGNVVAAGGNSAARFLVVTPIGRATVLRDVAQINAAGGCP